jgi:hypothetical protein
MNIPKSGDLYRHHKHDPAKGGSDHVYKIVAIGFDTEQDIIVVVYKPIYNSDFLQNKNATVFVRPLKMFTGKVLIEGVEILRFIKIDDIDLEE